MHLPPFKLEHYFARYEFTVPFVMCSSDCETLSVHELLSLEPDAAKELQDLRLGYTESLGNPVLRKEVASLYDEVHADQVLIHTGAEEPIFNFVNSTLQAGDHMIIHWPSYQSLFEVARSVGCEVTKWETREQDRWELDVDFLKDNLRANTRVVIINCPHNPTGYLMTKGKQQEIDRLSREHGFIIFSDEVYRFSEYRDEERLPAWCDLNETAVSLGVMSKTFGLAGLRLGWIATRNRKVYEEMAGFKHYTSICNSAPSELLAAVALRNRGTIASRNRKIILENLDRLNSFFARHDRLFNWQFPKAGPIAFPSLTDGRDVEKFCHDLITQAGVLLLPGSVYSVAGSNFRIGFGKKDLPLCLEKLEGSLHLLA